MASCKHLLFVAGAILAVMLLCAGGAYAGSKSSKPEKNDEASMKWWNQPMQFAVVRHSSLFCEPDCPEWIAAEGKITGDTSAKLDRLLSNPAYRKLPMLLNSPGGDLNAALRMGRTLRKYGMITAVGTSELYGCAKDDLMANKCKPDPILNAYNGLTSPSAFCASACPLVLLGGTVRIVNPVSLVGLHEPKGTARPYMDRYMIHYRLINGRKQEVSRDFIKRTYLPTKTIIGVTPALRKQFSAYIKDMGGSTDIIDEMEKAAPAEMEWIPASGGAREHLGLISLPTPMSLKPSSLDELSGPTSCDPKKAFLYNCVHVKAKEPAAPADTTPKTDQPGAMTFTVTRLLSQFCEPRCPEWIAATGLITPDTPAKLEALLSNPKMRELPVLLDSRGGNGAAAMAMGRLIRKYQMNTAVNGTTLQACADAGHCGGAADNPRLGINFVSPSSCDNACLLMLLGGVTRVVYPMADLDLRPADDGFPFNEAQKQQYASYFSELKIPSQIMVELYYGSYHPTNKIPGFGSKRQDLGLVTDSRRDINEWISPDHCAKGARFLSNCVERDAVEQQAVTPQSANLGEPEMTFTLMRLEDAQCQPDCPMWITATGSITADTPKKFDDFIYRDKRLTLPILINSHGGSQEAAKKIGNMLRSFRIDVAVAASAFKGCSIFLDHNANCVLGRDDQIHDAHAVPAAGVCDGACEPLTTVGPAMVSKLLAPDRCKPKPQPNCTSQFKTKEPQITAAH